LPREDPRRIIGRGTWVDKIAWRLINREKRLGRDLSLIRTESGLGASGIPHIGSMADAVRSYAVTLALRDMGYNSETIAFSDDMDGLRSVPEGLPSWLEDYLLQPVSMIPDPFGCHRSYGEHMTSLLREALDYAGVDYRHVSAHEVYGRGVMKDIIREILLNHRRVGEIIYEETGQDKFLRQLPYFAVCKGCGRIYTTVALEFDPERNVVRYRCEGAEVKGKWYEGCGYEGWARIDRAEGKLSWKVEFAARWKLLDIRFEAYGKDIADSVRVNDRVSREILGFEPPLHVRYEMFLDASGRKISKSRGGVFTPQAWYRYGSPESLLLYLLKRFSGTRRVTHETVVNMMRELDFYKDVYFGRVKLDNPMKEARVKGLLEYAHRLGEVKPVKVPYDLLLSLAMAAPSSIEREFIRKRVEKYGYEVDEDVERLIDYVVNWVRDFGRPPEKPVRVELSDVERRAIAALIEKIRGLSDGEQIQGKIFEAAREHGIPPRDYFRKLYMIIIGRESGPRLGPLIADLGVDNVVRRLEEAVGAGGHEGA